MKTKQGFNVLGVIKKRAQAETATIEMYRKPTQADLLILCIYKHPHKNKMPAFTST